ncbi:hypothetical protein AVEN_150146-1 [Araneus ventricosus]|uniref:Uncharacterized protein n=1 Tax=Araneus ventricosus TaxID=182803 RepID=A0A4Y2LZN4_ARAVE|nr:hypothetical protein AVEN_150146-1 [Araneus ventricosus]
MCQDYPNSVERNSPGELIDKCLDHFTKPGLVKFPNAPINDLKLWESLNLHEKYEPEVAKAGLLTFNRYLLYLTEEAVTFSLFSKKVSDTEKKIAASLMKYKANKKSLPTGVAVFSAFNQTTKLHQMVGT